MIWPNNAKCSVLLKLNAINKIEWAKSVSILERLSIFERERDFCLVEKYFIEAIVLICRTAERQYHICYSAKVALTTVTISWFQTTKQPFNWRIVVPKFATKWKYFLMVSFIYFCLLATKDFLIFIDNDGNSVSTMVNMICARHSLFGRKPKILRFSLFDAALDFVRNFPGNCNRPWYIDAFLYQSKAFFSIWDVVDFYEFRKEILESR